MSDPFSRGQKSDEVSGISGAWDNAERDWEANFSAVSAAKSTDGEAEDMAKRAQRVRALCVTGPAPPLPLKQCAG